LLPFQIGRLTIQELSWKVKAYNDERRYQQWLTYRHAALTWFAMSEDKPSFEEAFPLPGDEVEPLSDEDVGKEAEAKGLRQPD
jgi:hypothetical protein